VSRRGGTWLPLLPLVAVPIALAALSYASLRVRPRPESGARARAGALLGAPSIYGRPLSARWAYGASFQRTDLEPPGNPNPHPEPQPHRDHPLAAAITSGGQKLYVTLPGNEDQPGNEVAVVDVASRRVARRIRVGRSPSALALHPAGRFLFVLNRLSNYASVIDTQRDEVAAEVPLDFYCERIVFDQKGTRAYVSNRYLDQVLVLDVDPAGRSASLRLLGGFQQAAFLRRDEPASGPRAALLRSCGTAGCHQRTRGGFYAGADPEKAFFSAIENAVPEDPDQSLLLRAVRPVAEGGFADDLAGSNFHAGGLVVWRRADPGYLAVAGWIAATRPGPGIPVGGLDAKPGPLALSADGRRLYVGNQGSGLQISIVDTDRLEETSAIFTQTISTDLALLGGGPAGREILVASSLGLGFGAPKERDPYGGETEDPTNPAAQRTVLRDIQTTEPLPLARQKILGPFDGIDGTAAFKMADIQNDILAVDVGGLELPDRAPSGQLRYALQANRYEAHRRWVRYTSDSAEVLPQDLGGDIPPELQRVVGAFPEDLLAVGDRLYAVMSGTYQLVEWRLDAEASEASDLLEPVRVFDTGIMPRRVVAGPAGSAAEGLLFVTCFLQETVRVLDTRTGTSTDIVVGDLSRPFPDSDAERGEVFVNTAIFSVDRDTSCMSCHIYGTSDGRGWGAGQAIAQMRDGFFVSGGMLAIPQLRNLFAIQPFYFEGTHTCYDAQLDDAREHMALQGFLAPNPQGDLTGIRRPAAPGARRAEHEEIQDKMAARPWGPVYEDLRERRDELVRRLTMRYFGKAFVFRDLQRFIGEYQAAEVRLPPSPFDRQNPSVERGRLLFNDLSIGCAVCHRPPAFADKREALYHNAQRVLPSLVTFTRREASFTLIGPSWMDTVNGFRRDLAPWEPGGAERVQGEVTTFQLRGLFDRPATFLHHGRALSIRETFAAPDHYALRRLRYPVLRGGERVRPGGRERGFNELSLLSERTSMPDTHGATSHLTARQVQDLESFLRTIE